MHDLVIWFQRRLILLVNSVWAVPVVLVARLFNPLIPVRIGGLRSRFMGHFISETSEQVHINNSRTRIEINIYYFNHLPVCNEQWAKLASRNLPIRQNIASMLDFWNSKVPGKRLHSIISNPNGGAFLENIENREILKLKFTPQEDSHALVWLKNLGWKEGEPFVCLNVRDSAYFEQEGKQRDGGKQNDFWDFTAYRNSDITTYVEGINWLLDQNVWVLRMGKTNHYELKIDHERFLDFSFSDSKSDFLDIWLFSNCFGIISTGSGPDILGAIYDIPILYLNTLPLSEIWVSANLLRIPKHLRRISTGKELTLAATLASSFQTTKEYELSGIKIIDLNSREILDGIQEFWGRIKGSWIENEEDEFLQTEFWAQFKNWPGHSKDHDWKHPKAKVGSAWLRSLGSEFLA